MSIPEYLDKIKRGGESRERLLYIAIIVLVGLSAFGLGRLSTEGEPSMQAASAGAVTTFRATQSAPEANVSSVPSLTPTSKHASSPEGQYLASKNGKLYYPAGCKAANRIKEENRVWFETAADAEKLGLTAASTCH